ncbi:unnamed protein product [Vicia faba]|uniref:Reverse transcriptase zinc-binding domain-containing protein n=1 Tax=Vicia faba TaxID=3906 RepID=A0AAV1B0Q0_VICFA|nr:unnamed protein product [Vicia faba]
MLWVNEGECPKSKESTWWRDISKLCDELRGITKKITIMVGDGNSTSLWKTSWLWQGVLADQFPVLSNIKVFVWRLVQDRVPTRKQFLKRIMLESHDVLCVFCEQHEEDLDHLLLHCPKVKPIWQMIQKWMDVELPTEGNCCLQFLKVVEVLKGKLACNKTGVIWLTVCWCI